MARIYHDEHMRRAPRCSRCGREGHNVRVCETREEVRRHTLFHRHGAEIPKGHRLISIGPGEDPPEGAKFIGYELPFQYTGDDQ